MPFWRWRGRHVPIRAESCAFGLCATAVCDLCSPWRIAVPMHVARSLTWPNRAYFTLPTLEQPTVSTRRPCNCWTYSGVPYKRASKQVRSTQQLSAFRAPMLPFHLSLGTCWSRACECAALALNIVTAHGTVAR